MSLLTRIHGLIPFQFLVLVLVASTSLLTAGGKSSRVRLADGFDYPVGKPDAKGYYKARGWQGANHLGEDWNAVTGGNTDLGDPVYSIGKGVVVLSSDIKAGWGNVVIIRHAYNDEAGTVRIIDSLYGHLDRRMVRVGQVVDRGQQIGTIGTAHGRYLAHLHFEIRKNISIGMNRTKFRKDLTNYHNPTLFIKKYRKLRSSIRAYPIPVETFSAYSPTGQQFSFPQGHDKAIKVPIVAVTSDEVKKSATPAGNGGTAARVDQIVRSQGGTPSKTTDAEIDGLWSKLRARLEEEDAANRRVTEK